VPGTVEGTIERTGDPDFGCQVAAAILSMDDMRSCRQGRFNARQGRMDEHDAMEARLKRERNEFPSFFPGLDEYLVKSPG